jgi:hypothetical protein
MRPARHYDLPGADIRPLWASVTGRPNPVAAKLRLRGISAARSAAAHRRIAEADTERIQKPAQPKESATT